ncbi:MAG: aminotransferase class IV [Bacteroidota bacterium]|nr:aminotransferase class IV [Bacteroidota bacterium]
MNELFFIYNDQFFISGTPVISAGNRSLRYGDGLFETMRLYNGQIRNVDFHFERLFKGLSDLQFEIKKSFSAEFLIKKIDALLKKNRHEENARIRLMVFRGDGGIFDLQNNSPHYIIETWSLPGKIELNTNGLDIDVFPASRKSCDQFSSLKTNNYLPYAMAGLFAKKNKLNDAILLNTRERVCESAIANIFIIQDENIFTPPLSEGCVAGIMRRCLLEQKVFKQFHISEKELSVEEVLNADECFLTNSIHPVRWVKNFGEKKYKNQKVIEIFQCVLNNME